MNKNIKTPAKKKMIKKQGKKPAQDKSLNKIIETAIGIPKPLNLKGRPTKYKPEMCKTIIELMAEGKSKITAMVEMGLNASTLYDWEQKHEDFSNAIKEGEQLSERWWVEAGRLNLWNKNFHAVLWMMNMQNRLGWSRKVEGLSKIEVTTDQKHEMVKSIEEEKPIEHTAAVLEILVGCGAIKSPTQETTTATTH